MSDHYYWTTLDTNFSTPPIQQLLRSYHSSDESDPGSHGGGGFRPSGENSGRAFIGGHSRPHSGPSFSVDGRLVVEDAPFFPPREAPPAQYVSPASLHLQTDEIQVSIFARERVSRNLPNLQCYTVWRLRPEPLPLQATCRGTVARGFGPVWLTATLLRTQLRRRRDRVASERLPADVEVPRRGRLPPSTAESSAQRDRQFVVASRATGRGET